LDLRNLIFPGGFRGKVQDSKVDLIIFRISQGVRHKTVIFFLRTQRRPAMDRSSCPSAVPAAQAMRRREKGRNRTRKHGESRGALTIGGF
jgi:hypothetical protein